MGQGRRYFTDEFKREAVALLVSSGRPLSPLASELGISPSMLGNWRNGSGGGDAGSRKISAAGSTAECGDDPGDRVPRGISPRPKRPNSTTPIGRLASSSAAIRTAAIGCWI